MKGSCFIDPEKLNALAQITNLEGMSANIHWIITGDGTPMIRKNGSLRENEHLLLNKLDTLPPSKKAALITLLN